MAANLKANAEKGVKRAQRYSSEYYREKMQLSRAKKQPRTPVVKTENVSPVTPQTPVAKFQKPKPKTPASAKPPQTPVAKSQKPQPKTPAQFKTPSRAEIRAMPIATLQKKLARSEKRKFETRQIKKEITALKREAKRQKKVHEMDSFEKEMWRAKYQQEKLLRRRDQKMKSYFKRKGEGNQVPDGIDVEEETDRAVRAWGKGFKKLSWEAQKKFVHEVMDVRTWDREKFEEVTQKAKGKYPVELVQKFMEACSLGGLTSTGSVKAYELFGELLTGCEIKGPSDSMVRKWRQVLPQQMSDVVVSKELQNEVLWKNATVIHDEFAATKVGESGQSTALWTSKGAKPKILLLDQHSLSNKTAGSIGKAMYASMKRISKVGGFAWGVPVNVPKLTAGGCITSDEAALPASRDLVERMKASGVVGTWWLTMCWEHGFSAICNGLKTSMDRHKREHGILKIPNCLTMVFTFDKYFREFNRYGRNGSDTFQSYLTNIAKKDSDDEKANDRPGYLFGPDDRLQNATETRMHHVPYNIPFILAHRQDMLDYFNYKGSMNRLEGTIHEFLTSDLQLDHCYIASALHRQFFKWATVLSPLSYFGFVERVPPTYITDCLTHLKDSKVARAGLLSYTRPPVPTFPTCHMGLTVNPGWIHKTNDVLLKTHLQFPRKMVTKVPPRGTPDYETGKNPDPEPEREMSVIDFSSTRASFLKLKWMCTSALAFGTGKALRSVKTLMREFKGVPWVRKSIETVTLIDQSPESMERSMDIVPEIMQKPINACHRRSRDHHGKGQFVNYKENAEMCIAMENAPMASDPIESTHNILKTHTRAHKTMDLDTAGGLACMKVNKVGEAVKAMSEEDRQRYYAYIGSLNQTKLREEFRRVKKVTIRDRRAHKAANLTKLHNRAEAQKQRLVKAKQDADNTIPYATVAQLDKALKAVKRAGGATMSTDLNRILRTQLNYFHFHDVPAASYDATLVTNFQTTTRMEAITRGRVVKCIKFQQSKQPPKRKSKRRSEPQPKPAFKKRSKPKRKCPSSSKPAAKRRRT